MYTSTSTADQPTDPIVDKVIKKYHERSQAGIKKYGTMLTRDDLSTTDWLKHAQEEAMDFSLYLEKLMIVMRENHLSEYYDKAAEIVGKEINRLEPVYRFMEALNINMDSTFQISAKNGSMIEIKVSDVFNNL